MLLPIQHQLVAFRVGIRLHPYEVNAVYQSLQLQRLLLGLVASKPLLLCHNPARHIYYCNFNWSIRAGEHKVHRTVRRIGEDALYKGVLGRSRCENGPSSQSSPSRVNESRIC